MSATKASTEEFLAEEIAYLRRLVDSLINRPVYVYPVSPPPRPYVGTPIYASNTTNPITASSGTLGAA